MADAAAAAKLRTKAIKYILLARYNARLFSKDPHTKVGCIALAPDFSRVLATGINGFPRGLDDDAPGRWDRPTKYAYVTHAEANAVACAAQSGAKLGGSVAVCTMFPCSMCTKLLIQSGIARVYAVKPDYESPTWGEDARTSQQMFSEAGVDVVVFDEAELERAASLA